MTIEARFVADGTQRQGWTSMTQFPGETNAQALDRKQAAHEQAGWTITSRTGNAMTAVKDYPQNAGTQHATHKERYFRTRN